MKILVLLMIVFSISFLLIYTIVYKENKKEDREKKLNGFGLLFVACLLALAPTAVIALVLFVLLSSTSAVNMLFSLQISTKQLIILVISFIIYWFSLDSLIEIIVKHIVGKNPFYYILLLCIRIFAAYTIGLFIGLNQLNNFAIATGATMIVLLIEILYELHEKKKDESSNSN
ncbi:hypothetical protein [Bacillus sp. SD088]|uniref:hypothetical protein n=1 Tax=Bacillus sp. SD088 TaxID=2782012 RepID=UPI001A978191|nr:hypothetical protein [Bacillus sp. SD088]MBO0992552.1 hypothetical protein [Bacillus sp. SD088]